MVPALFLILTAYFCGSVPTGKILTRWRLRVDITKTGSGNIGATNVLRQAGPALGLATLAGDAAKGALPVLLTAWALKGGANAGIWTAMAALAAFLGHLHPVYTRFQQGGKGVATATGCLLVLAPKALGLAVLVFAAAVAVSRRASPGSLAAAASLCPLVIWTTGSAPKSALALTMAILIWVRHRENIKRLLAGTEPKIF